MSASSTASVAPLIGGEAERSPQRWRQLSLIAGVEILAMSLWFSASAVVPALTDRWHLTSGGAAWLTTSVQLGFVAGAVASAAFNLPDAMSAKTLVMWGAALGALANAAFVVCAHGLGLAIPLRFATGVALAAVYPPGIKLVASWFVSRRGVAIGVLVGALSVGSGLPHLINGVASWPWTVVLLSSSALALAGAALAAVAVREGPHLSRAPALSMSYAVRMFSARAPRLINFGYFGHMWELYAFWAWIPGYLAASLAAWRVGADTRAAVELGSFAAIGVAGAFGCVLGGLVSDRYGRARLTIAAMAISAICAVATPLTFGAHPAIVGALVLVWGAAVIADSAQFSAYLSERADPRYVGTALTVQMALGFLITVLSIRLVPVVEGVVGWRYALPVLAAGPLLGAFAMNRLSTNPGPDSP